MGLKLGPVQTFFYSQCKAWSPFADSGPNTVKTRESCRIYANGVWSIVYSYRGYKFYFLSKRNQKSRIWSTWIQMFPMHRICARYTDHFIHALVNRDGRYNNSPSDVLAGTASLLIQKETQDSTTMSVQGIYVWMVK